MKNNNINQNRRDFLKKTSLGVAGASLSGGVVGSVVAPNAVAAESSMQTVVTAAHWGPLGVVVQDGKVVKSGPAIEPAVPNELQSEKAFLPIREKATPPCGGEMSGYAFLGMKPWI